jgi:hypothetical protein
MVGTSRMLALGEQQSTAAIVGCFTVSRATFTECGMHSEQRLAREFMSYSLGLDGELSAQSHADIPLLYGAVAQVTAARQAAISAGLATHTAQPAALLHPSARAEARVLGDAIAQAYKTDALRDLQQQSLPPSTAPSAPATVQPSAQPAGAGATTWQQHYHSEHVSSVAAVQDTSVGNSGQVGQAVHRTVQGRGDEAQHSSGSSGGYDDDEFTEASDH